jgi:hypothetical protein
VSALQYGTLQYSALQCSAGQCSTAQYITVKYLHTCKPRSALPTHVHTVQYSTVRYLVVSLQTLGQGKVQNVPYIRLVDTHPVRYCGAHNLYGNQLKEEVSKSQCTVRSERRKLPSLLRVTMHSVPFSCLFSSGQHGNNQPLSRTKMV